MLSYALEEFDESMSYEKSDMQTTMFTGACLTHNNCLKCKDYSVWKDKNG